MELEPINLVGLVAVIMGCLGFLIPIAGLTARFALKPAVEAIARLREGTTNNEAIRLLERRLALLEQEQQALLELRTNVERLTEAVDFQKKLESPRGAVER